MLCKAEEDYLDKDHDPRKEQEEEEGKKEERRCQDPCQDPHAKPTCPFMEMLTHAKTLELRKQHEKTRQEKNAMMQ